MSLQLEGRTALVTGSASGIGRAVVQRFLSEGANVVGFDRVETRIEGSDGAARFACIVGDVRSAADNQRTVDATVSRFGGLDVLIANAGIYDNRRALRTFSPTELDAAFDELFAVNVKGYMLAALAAAGVLAKARGCIIFTSSVSGSHAGFGGPLYVAAKHAVNGLTKQLALELAPEIRVNAVAPGYVPTGLRGIECLGQETLTTGPEPRQLPLQAIATADDYTGAYVFLASEACSRSATGTILALDGGASVRGPRA